MAETRPLECRRANGARTQISRRHWLTRRSGLQVPLSRWHGGLPPITGAVTSIAFVQLTANLTKRAFGRRCCRLSARRNGCNMVMVLTGTTALKSQLWRLEVIGWCLQEAPGGGTRSPLAILPLQVEHSTFDILCTGPTFEPPAPGAWGFGPGSCASSLPGTSCNRKQLLNQNFDFGIVDKVKVPDVPPGDYVISFRWDSEQTPQVWNSCADVKIVADGKTTKAFTPTRGCHGCCPHTNSLCSNCTGCLNDKTGDCSYCWKVLPGYNPAYAPPITCLGHEAPDGGPKDWQPGDSIKGGWSPGCPKCWANMEESCSDAFRPFEEDEIAV